MNNAIPDDVKHLVGDEMMDTVPQGDGDLDYESFVKEYSPEAICQGEDQNGDDEGANDPLARSVPTDDEFDPPTAEFAGYWPTHHELLQLAEYWAKRSLGFSVNGILFGFYDDYESRLAAISAVRLRRIAKLVGDEAVQTVAKQVEDGYRYSLGDRIWEIFTKGSREDLETVRWAIRANWPESNMAAPPVPQGMLPADVGAVDCTPKTWRLFEAFCNGSGLREELSEQVCNLWDDFISRRK